MSDSSIAASILELPLDDRNDAGSYTVRGFFIDILKTLWNEKESFSGKRPFGNSGWQYDLYAPLIIAGLIDGNIDSDGYIVELSESSTRRADHLLMLAIGHL